MDLATIIVGRKIPGEDECRVIYKIYSPGLVGGLSGFKEFMLYTLPRIQLQLALIYVTTQSFHLFFRRFGLPRILSEILVCDLRIHFLHHAESDYTFLDIRMIIS